MTTLREAAQQALEALEYIRSTTVWQADKHAANPAINALKAALEQPGQAEPVATVAMDVSRTHISWYGKYLGQRPDMKIAMLLKDLPVGTLLFTAPPRREWRSLSEEERADILFPLTAAGASDMECSRAVEAKLKELNHG
jgi:hypothetical protein